MFDKDFLIILEYCYCPACDQIDQKPPINQKALLFDDDEIILQIERKNEQTFLSVLMGGQEGILKIPNEVFLSKFSYAIPDMPAYDGQLVAVSFEDSFIRVWFNNEEISFSEYDEVSFSSKAFARGEFVTDLIVLEYKDRESEDTGSELGSVMISTPNSTPSYFYSKYIEFQKSSEKAHFWNFKTCKKEEDKTCDDDLKELPSNCQEAFRCQDGFDIILPQVAIEFSNASVLLPECGFKEEENTISDLMIREMRD